MSWTALKIVFASLAGILFIFVPSWITLFAAFQGVSKALARMRVEMIKTLGGIDNFHVYIEKLYKTTMKMLIPLELMIDHFADLAYGILKALIGSIYKTDAGFQQLNGTLMLIQDTVALVVSYIFAIKEIGIEWKFFIDKVMISIKALSQMGSIGALVSKGPMGIIRETKKAWQQSDDDKAHARKGMYMHLDEVFDRLIGLDKTRETKEAKIEINGMNINQEFKDKISPDRVAFSVVEVLQGLAENPTQGTANRKLPRGRTKNVGG